MPARKSRLLVKRPSKTTVQFTVSTAFARDTLTSRLRQYAGHGLRLIFAAFSLWTLYTKWLFFKNPELSSEALATRLDVAILYPQLRVVQHTDWRILAILSGAMLWGVVQKGYAEESLLVIRGLGVQTSTSAPTFFTPATTRFIPTTMIQDIFLHEAFKGFEVRHYLSIVVDGEEDAVVVFPSLLPRRMMLEEVWRGARACLYEMND